MDTGGSRYSLHDSHFYTGQDKRAYQLLNSTSLTTVLAVSQAQTSLNNAVSEGFGVTHVNAHDFAAKDAASPPRWSYDKVIDLMEWTASQQDAGVFEMNT